MAILTSVQRYAFFCDESGITQDRFTLVGGLIIPVDEVKNIQIVLKNFREQQGMKKELKWTKITNQKLNEYQSLVGTFFQFNMEDKCHFQCICIDSHKLNHQRFNSGDRDVGLSKIYFQLLYHKFVKTHGRNNLLYVRMDQRNSSTPLSKIKDMLNARAARDDQILHGPVKAIEAKDSKECDILQMNDVILGAVAAYKNGKHLNQDGRLSKREVAELVFQKSGLTSYDHNTPASTRRFSIWNMRLQD